MKDRGTPVSLFSFQDIVTSLTGIMVIVILVIVLQLAEATYDYENPKSAPQGYLDLKDKIAELAGRLRSIKEGTEEIPDEYKRFLPLSDEEIDEQLRAAEHTRDMLNAEKSSNDIEAQKISDTRNAVQQKLKSTEEKVANLRQVKKGLDDSRQALAADDTNAGLEQMIQQLSQQCERIRNEIRESADRVEFSFKGVMSRTPILIECTGQGFRAQVYKSGEGVVDFMGGGYNSNLSALRSWLRAKDLKRCYPVLLFRPDGFSHLTEVELMLYEIDKNIVIGKEPLNNNVKVFQ